MTWGSFLAPFTATVCAAHGGPARRTPADAVRPWRGSSAPAWMGFTVDELRLPLRETCGTTKRSRAMEIAHGAVNVLPTPVTRARLPVGCGGVRPPLFGDLGALPTALLLAALARTCGRLAAYRAKPLTGFPPSFSQRAGVGTSETTGPIRRVELLSAGFAQPRLVHLSHISIVPREERWAEAGVKRLAQMVMPMEVPA